MQFGRGIGLQITRGMQVLIKGLLRLTDGAVVELAALQGRHGLACQHGAITDCQEAQSHPRTGAGLDLGCRCQPHHAVVATAA